jgi:hypothetical protein
MFLAPAWFRGGSNERNDRVAAIGDRSGLYSPNGIEGG